MRRWLGEEEISHTCSVIFSRFVSVCVCVCVCVTGKAILKAIVVGQSGDKLCYC